MPMKRLCLSVLSVLLVLLTVTGLAYAQYTSTNYKTSEVFFGSGGDPNQSSTNYKAGTSLGGLAGGTGSSTNYRAYYGFLTPSEPFLKMTVNSSSLDLGNLDPSTTVHGSATFDVTAYVDSGYVVQTMSQPPKYTSGANSHTLAAMSLGSTVVGTEQFGINLVANTSPATFGANPAPQPNSSFANGQAATGYGTPNQYKYNAGDTIACSGTSGTCTGSGWGDTTYTISYVANVSPFTPAGNYRVNQDLVAVATY